MGIQNWEQINADMQRGYSHSMNNDSVTACNEWRKAWDGIVNAMHSDEYATIEDFDEDFDGLQSVFNWASDYELVLLNATEKDIHYAKERISFCNGYLERISDKHGQNSLNMRAAIANCYFQLGMTEDGEKEYKALISECPAWGWGWIKWSDEYSYNMEERDYGRAIELLKTALDVDGVDEIPVIKERLKEAYEDCGMHEEASSVVIDEWDYGVPLSEIGNVTNVLKNELDNMVKDIFELHNTTT